MADEGIYELPNERKERIELNKRYRAIPLKDTTSRTLRKYFSAAANLYGIIKLRKLYEIISSQSPNLVTRDEFLKFAEVAKDEIEGYEILGEKDLYIDGKETPFMEYEVIANMVMLADEDRYDLMVEEQEDKPFYIPEKKVFLQYSDFMFYEVTDQSTNLYNFYVDRLGLTDLDADDSISDLSFSLRTDLQNPFKTLEILNNIYDADIDLSEKDMETFIHLFEDFSNHSRMQCNRGFTPTEMYDMMPKPKNPTMSLGPNIKRQIASGEVSIDELRKGVLLADDLPDSMRFSLLKEIADLEKLAPKPKKVGRNDPCPCGSGKKYKNCCGR